MSVSAPLSAVIMSSQLEVMKVIVTSVGDSIHVTDSLATMRSCPNDAGEREPVPQESKWATAWRLDAMAYCTDTPERKRKPQQVSEDVSKHRSERRRQVCERVPWGVADWPPSSIGREPDAGPQSTHIRHEQSTFDDGANDGRSVVLRPAVARGVGAIRSEDVLYRC